MNRSLLQVFFLSRRLRRRGASHTWLRIACFYRNMWQRFETIYSERHILSHDVVKVQASGFKRGTIAGSWQES